MPRFLSVFGTWYIAAGFIGNPLAALATIAVYVFVSPTRGHVGLAIAAGLAVWVLAGVAVWWIYQTLYQHARDVNPGQYQDMFARLQLDRRLIANSPPPPPNQPLAVAARQTADELLARLDPLLLERQSGGTWLTADGYLEAWSDIYRLEEAMVLLVPIEQILAMAAEDTARLTDSKIPNRGTLQQGLVDAVQGLTPNDYSKRAKLAGIRRSINRYRQEQWSGLVDERNRAMLAAAIAGLVAYLGLISVVIARMDPKAVQVALALVITGSLVCLLHQATVVGAPETGIEDFGQSTARLLSATVVSGVIALLGVIVFQGAGLTVNGVPLINSFNRWKDTFDWTQNRGAFFVAALFGFAPSLLFDVLQSRADSIKKQLETSQAAGSTSGTS